MQAAVEVGLLVDTMLLDTVVWLIVDEMVVEPELAVLDICEDALVIIEEVLLRL